MPNNPDLTRSPHYYAARATEERRLAMAAKDRAVRAIHLEMAERYDALVKDGGEGPHDTPQEEQQQAG